MNTNMNLAALLKLVADDCESVLEFSQELSDYVRDEGGELPYVVKLIDERDEARRQRNDLSDDLERTRQELDELKARVAGLEK